MLTSLTYKKGFKPLPYNLHTLVEHCIQLSILTQGPSSIDPLEANDYFTYTCGKFTEVLVGV